MISKKDLKKLQKLLEETDYGDNTIYIILKGKIPKKMIEEHRKKLDNIKKHTETITLKERVKADQAMAIMPSAVTYKSIKEWILSGLNIDDICAGLNEEAQKKALKMLKEMQIVAAHSKKDADGKLVPDEEMVDLLNLVQRDPITTIEKIKAELEVGGICSKGKIDNIINSVFDGNRYTSCYIFTRMGDSIQFEEGYDKDIYHKIKQETARKLDKIILPLERLEVSKKVNSIKDPHK